uniref:Putative mitochondrial chaperone bcs1 n=1 Tax=Aegilops tauschii TaxID=37682 RepID=R7VZH5_AEGTA
MASSAEGAAVVDAYKKALATAASVSAYAMLARGMARELLPDELRAAVRWGAAFVRSRFSAPEKERHAIVIRRVLGGGYNEDDLFDAALTYLATKINPQSMSRLCLARTRKREPDGSGSCSTLLSMENGGSTTDTFQGVEFRWTSIESGGNDGNNRGKECLELSFDAEHTETALHKYVPFITSTAEELRLRDRALKIFLNQGSSWKGINHHHPATFDTLAMDPSVKQAVIDDLDRFLKRKEYYRRIGKAWKRGYLLYGPPGTGKSSLVAAMANYLRGCSSTCPTSLVIEDIDCSFDTMSREDRKVSHATYTDDEDDEYDHARARGYPPERERKITLSGLLNFIDGLWSTCGEERVIVFTTNYKDRLDRALLRPGRMDMHVYMGHCGWEAFRTLAGNYHLVDDHALFPEIRELLSVVEVTPAEVSEMLLRSEDVDVALRVLIEFLQQRRCKTNEETMVAS